MTDEFDDAEMLDDAALAELLASPSVWIEPAADLDARVVLAVLAARADAGSSPSDDPSIALGSSADQRLAPVVPITATRARRRWVTTAAAAVVAAAAAVAVTLVAVPRDERPSADGTIVLTGTDLAAGAGGNATFRREQSGVRIELSVGGLPRRDGDEFYEGWLKSCDGARLVPIGTFHELDQATGWAGVDLAAHPLLTVTREHVAGPKDPAQGSSGEVVVSGSYAPCP